MNFRSRCYYYYYYYFASNGQRREPRLERHHELSRGRLESRVRW